MARTRQRFLTSVRAPKKLVSDDFHGRPSFSRFASFAGSGFVSGLSVALGVCNQEDVVGRQSKSRWSLPGQQGCCQAHRDTPAWSLAACESGRLHPSTTNGSVQGCVDCGSHGDAGVGFLPSAAIKGELRPANTASRYGNATMTTSWPRESLTVDPQLHNAFGESERQVRPAVGRNLALRKQHLLGGDHGNRSRSRV